MNERYVVQGLEADPALAAEAMQRLEERGLAGPVTVIAWDGRELPYADNLVNLLVVEPGARVDADEVMRVLRPEGVALVGAGRRRERRVKPWPDDIDEWTHYLHGPDNNAVAEDTRVGPPRRMQWVSGPRLGRSHDHLSSVSAVVTARGRIFAIVDEGPAASVKADSKWMLVARDAFNGVLLWKKEVAPWEGQLRPFRSGPAELPRRLVAVGDRVYATLGYGKPVVALEAATGELIHTFTGTENAHEIVCGDGKLFVVVSAPLQEESPTTGKVLRRFPVWRDSYLEYTVAYGKLESVWPVPGTVLVHDGPEGAVAYAAAGRTSYADGGVHLCGVDAVTGKLRFRRTISHMDPETGNEPQKSIRGVTMPGAMPDILSTDGKSIFMRHQRFDLEGQPLKQDVDHIFSAAGFVDGSWWHRSYLQIGRSMSGGYGGWTSAGNSRISGKALVRGAERAYGFGRKQYTITGSHLGLQSEFRLFAADVKPAAAAKGQSGKKGRKAKSKVNYVWQRPADVLPRAMVLAGETLFLAGPRDVEDFTAAKPRGEVFLLAVSAEDGAEKARRKLKASPVHDSFAVAGGMLFFATVDGRVVCWK